MSSIADILYKAVHQKHPQYTLEKINEIVDGVFCTESLDQIIVDPKLPDTRALAALLKDAGYTGDKGAQLILSGLKALSAGVRRNDEGLDDFISDHGVNL